MLNGVEQTSLQTVQLIHGMKALMQEYKDKIREQLPKIYSQDLLNNLFAHPYTKIEFVMDELSVTRLTATKYLDQLVEIGGVLSKHKMGRDNYFINDALCTLLLKS